MTDMTHRLFALQRAVNDTLVASHGLQSHLAADRPPFWNTQGDLSEVERESTSIAVALKHYGPGPLFDLWRVLNLRPGLIHHPRRVSGSALSRCLGRVDRAAT